MLFIGKSYKQSHAEIGQKIEQMLSKTLRLNFCYFKIIHIFHSLYRSKVIRHALIKKQKNIYACIHGIMRVIMMKMKMKMKNRSYRYDIDRPSLDMDTIK